MNPVLRDLGLLPVLWVASSVVPMRSLTVLLVVVALVGVGCSSSDDEKTEPTTTEASTDYEPVLDEVPCEGEQFAPPRLPDGVGDATCGTLTVPEDRHDPDAGSVVLPVTVVPGSNATADPLVYVHGGPGDTGFGADRISPRCRRWPRGRTSWSSTSAAQEWPSRRWTAPKSMRPSSPTSGRLTM